MRSYITLNPLGVFAFDGEGSVLAKVLFEGTPERVAEKLKAAEDGLIEEEERLISLLEGYEVVLEKPCRVPGLEVRNPHAGGEHLRGNLVQVLEELSCSEVEYRRLLHQVCLAKAEMDLKEAAARKDKRVIQAVDSLQELDETLNVLTSRLREWLALIAPSFEGTQGGLEEMLERAEGSDDEALGAFAHGVKALHQRRCEVEGHITEAMEEIAPNLTGLTGPLLGARLIALAKGLSNLALMPGSRVQILGAGRAFFKGKRKKRRPPKHGAIYQHPRVKGSPWWQRGKIARSLGSKIAIAARIDAFSGSYAGEKLKEDFNKRVEHVRRQYPDEPKKMRIIRRSKK